MDQAENRWPRESPYGAPPALVRISTAGSVDDGKSTLIGRLLLDTKSILADQLAHVEEASRRRGFARTELALLTDGLRAEREQGITIDVAYRYFATARRKFIVADTPGHVQYTRNMVTGASTADVAVVLVDSRHGLVDQSRRHLALSALLRVPNLIVAVNKIDLIDYDERRFREIEGAVLKAARAVEAPVPTVVPLSALHGDNVVARSLALPWYEGPPLLTLLELIEPSSAAARPARFPVQWVIRPQTDDAHDHRSYAGTVATGTLRRGDAIRVFPSGEGAHVVAIDTFDGELACAEAGRAVAVRLDRAIDVARGDLIASAPAPPRVGKSFEATVAWMAERGLAPRSRFLLKHTTRTVRALVDRIDARLSVTTLEDEPASSLAMNDIGRISLRTTEPLAYEPYRDDRVMGGFILIDEATQATVAAGMIQS